MGFQGAGVGNGAPSPWCWQEPHGDRPHGVSAAVPGTGDAGGTWDGAWRPLALRRGRWWKGPGVNLGARCCPRLLLPIWDSSVPCEMGDGCHFVPQERGDHQCDGCETAIDLQAGPSEQLLNCNNAYLLLIGRAIRIKRSPHPLALPAVGLQE